MLYKIRDNVQPNTTEQTAQEKTLKISRGIITQWIIFFPEEAADLLHLKILYHDHQLVPYNRDEDLYGGGIVFNIPEYYEIFEKPYELVCKAWNTDDTNEHEYVVHVNIIEERYLTPRITSPTLIERIRSFFGGGT